MKNITPDIYDGHILDQGLQVQIDTYYEPKEISLKRRIKIVLEAVSPCPCEKILDIGCGAGGFAFHCAKLKALSFGIDYSKASIETSRRLCERYGVSENATFIVANAVYLPFRDCSFDKIVAADFIEHITLEEKEMLLSEIRRVLKNEGICVIFTPNRIREKLGEVYWKVRHLLFRNKVPSNELHFGLTTRFQFGSMLKKIKFNFRFEYKDITRPYLAKIPFLKHFLSLNLLWTVRKDGS
jgi:ubiquinone/menaquinone biosynthesis C-methylase UbiE